ncbi:hypothetical protein DLAC_11487 [Tieghemostelium lacteum]|uniref:Uncharacterized protein n=1 Tax=Tieghemostelium lacteum TaxID=361077 RepID=A0A152A6F9_TIELA|nr:hypothetical protein DLAC_11487 [Tieghemostelium lacteum]|eukprot:KYR01685.1 hypothetical protein DLAC_11487 [Tieghemostelium lacteum]
MWGVWECGCSHQNVVCRRLLYLSNPRKFFCFIPPSFEDDNQPFFATKETSINYTLVVFFCNIILFVFV